MREFEKKDLQLAAAGGLKAQFRVERHRDVLKSNAEKRKTALQDATPLWADRKAIKALYAEARRLSAVTGTKHEVDHIIPLQGQKVCGLHVPWNLRVITKAENVRKHSSFGDEDVVGFLAERGFKVIFGINRLKRAIRLGKREVLLSVGPEGEAILGIAYVQGEFVIDAVIGAVLHPQIAISRIC